jgi:hypothetical protein
MFSVKEDKYIYSIIPRQILPNRRKVQDEYEIPQYADKPHVVFKTAAELIDYLTINKNEVHTVYWSSTDKSDIKGAMCFYKQRTNNTWNLLRHYVS